MSRGIGFFVFVAAIFGHGYFGEAQQAMKVTRIGYFSGGADPSTPGLSFEAFRQGLRDLGHIEGKNILFEYRYAEGNRDRIPSLVAELVQLKVDVILTGNLTAIRAAKQATQTIPIVMVTNADPVAAGLIDSLVSAPEWEYHGAHKPQPRLKRKTAGIT